MISVIVVNGKPRVGKDTFVDACVGEIEANGRGACSYSSVDSIKQAAKMMGWDGVKREEDREFLSQLKDMASKQYNHSMVQQAQLIFSGDYDVIFCMIREPEEIRNLGLLCEMFPSFITFRAILIKDKESESKEFDYHSDNDVENYHYDDTIMNHKTNIANWKAEAKAWTKQKILVQNAWV